jgi:S-(hydroxymethyl)glutathione dehydrogenase/alcohol dehydrogenase
MIASTQAAILAQSRSPLIIDEIRLPETLDYGQVLVRLLYTGICGSQLGEIDAKKGEDRFLPHMLGHEASGTVLQCGPGVRHVAEGDLVVLHWRKGLGIESATPVYTWRGRRLNAGWIATFASHAIISENRMTKVPADSPADLLPLFGCAVTTGLGVIVNNARVRVGESVVVFGAGGVGLNVIQGAHLAGAFPIIAVDLFDKRLALATRLGATHAVNSRNQDAPQAIAGILSGYGQPAGADVCIDNTGDTTVIAQAYNLAHGTGRMVCVGVPAVGEAAAIHTLPLHFGKSITGSHGGETMPHEDIPRYLRLLASGRLRLDALITETYPLAAINTAIERMRSGETAGRCLIDCR